MRRPGGNPAWVATSFTIHVNHSGSFVPIKVPLEYGRRALIALDRVLVHLHVLPAIPIGDLRPDVDAGVLEVHVIRRYPNHLGTTEAERVGEQDRGSAPAASPN